MAEDKPSIEATPNGPYLVRQLNDLRNSKGQEIETQPVITLCRCGGALKPDSVSTMDATCSPTLVLPLYGVKQRLLKRLLYHDKP